MDQEDSLASLFTRAAATYDRTGPPVFEHWGRRLVARASLARGSTVLDVASGRGAILFPAAEQVGPQGHVIGLDAARGMVAALAVDVRRLHLSQVTLCHAEAGRLAFPTSTFDHVLCGHAIIFFPEAMTEFRRVLKNGGRVGLTIIARGCFNWLLDAFERYRVAEDDGADNAIAEQPDAVPDTVEGLRSLLQAAGFQQIEVSEESAEFVYPDEAAWWATLWTLGFRGTLERMPPPTVEALRLEVCHRLQPFKSPDGIHLRFRVLFAWGTK